MLCLNIRQTPAQVAITTQNSRLQLRTTQAELEMQSSPATLEIRQAKGEFEMDFTQFRYSIGIKNLQDFSRDFAQEGKQAALEAIGKIVADGNRLARIESGENAVVNMAADSVFSPEGQLEWTKIEPPSINYRYDSAKIDVIQGKLDINVNRGTVENLTQLGNVDIQMKQYQSVKFWTTENKYDLKA
ncbi:hypothetical protein SDC9_67758 [bioreactor metagenome]|uniref:Uncharacterized protein n=1 Tax=bioreactor metagenome TaxID=1076179 RepID=A0A644Y551_9ZZZZ